MQGFGGLGTLGIIENQMAKGIVAIIYIYICIGLCRDYMVVCIHRETPTWNPKC